MNSLLFVDCRVEVLGPDGDGAFDFAGIHILIATQPAKVLSRRPSFDAITVVLGFEFVGSAVLVAQPYDVTDVITTSASPRTE